MKMSSKAKKVVALIFVVVAIFAIAGLRVSTHTVYSQKTITMKKDQAELQCPYLIVTDNDYVLAEEIMAMPEIKQVLEKAKQEDVVDKSIIENKLEEVVSSFYLGKLGEVSVLGDGICIDGFFGTENNIRCILTINQDATIHKVVSDNLSSEGIIYENDSNEVYEKHTQHFDLMKSLFA